jgi:hypothetical protein
MWSAPIVLHQLIAVMMARCVKTIASPSLEVIMNAMVTTDRRIVLVVVLALDLVTVITTSNSLGQLL